MQGHCPCGAITYHLSQRPLFTHACHCTWCQRESGAAFALNAIIESEFLYVEGVVEQTNTPSASGKGQIILRCPTCKVALYSHYAGAGRLMAFVRVGTLTAPTECPPDIHIFTSTKQPWLRLDDKIPAVSEFYDRKACWPQSSLDRRALLMAKHTQPSSRPHTLP